jgi:hypothetical protein
MAEMAESRRHRILTPLTPGANIGYLWPPLLGDQLAAPLKVLLIYYQNHLMNRATFLKSINRLG